MSHFPKQTHHDTGLVGVGLRSEHYQDVLEEASGIDFVEVHSENFFAEGGVTSRYLSQLQQTIPISLHGTAMGLGSGAGIDSGYLARLQRLTQQIEPLLVSDHACFCWTGEGNQVMHAGDLLPLKFDEAHLDVIANNVDRVQNQLGRQILVENIVSYVPNNKDFIDENEFLVELTKRTGAGLLLDLNNLIVNAINFDTRHPLDIAKNWLAKIPADVVGEIHLAGFSSVQGDALVVDDHSQPVSDMCWQLYRVVMSQMGPKPTLIEWDNDLTSWAVLKSEADKARAIMASI